jgi:myo-inositol-1(or 4)-monophosphatase
MSAVIGAPTSNDELVALAARLAVEAGTTALDGRRTVGVRHADTKSSAVDMVTEYDRAAERMIVDGILAARPDDGIVGEEGADHTGTSGVVWHIDPIDGTTNFLYDLPGWAVSIGACRPTDSTLGFHHLDTVAGAVYLPATAELFTAMVGRGAWLNGEPIVASSTTDISLALVGTGLAYVRERRVGQLAQLNRVMQGARDIRRLGAASVDLCYTAAGRLDAYFEEWLSTWDMAAGELIAREAGCITTSIDGGEPTPRSMLACNPRLHGPLLDLLRSP